MAEVKVITIQGGEDFLAALTKLLGSDVAAAVDSVVKQAGVDVKTGTVSEPVAESYEPDEVDESDEDFSEESDEESDEETDECECCESCGAALTKEDDKTFGEVTVELDESEDCFTKTYSVVDAEDLNVKVTPTGVVVSGKSDYAGAEFSDTIAPYGAYDEVTAFFNSDDETLEVTLWKVPDEGTDVEIEGW